MYINMVREPTARFVSDYYFRRFEHPKPMSDETRNRTFDECVLQNFSECQVGEAFTIIPYFCGQEDICLLPSAQSLEKAKSNVDKYYGPIGITEDLKPSYALFEKTMPHFFENMSTVAEQSLGGLKTKYKTHKKPISSNAALKIMRVRLGIENEFYAFIRQRYVAFLKHYRIYSSLVN